MRSIISSVTSLLFTVILFVGLGSGLARLGWDASFLPGSSLSFRHGALLIGVWLTALAGLELARRQRTWAYLSPLLAAAGGVWMCFAPFARPPLVLLLVAAILLLLFNIIGARNRAPMAMPCRIAGSTFLLIGNVLLFPGMPSHVVTSWWFGFALFSLLGLRLDSGDIHIGGKGRVLLIVLVLFALVGAAMKNYALGVEFIDPSALAPWQRWGGDRLLGLVMASAAIWLTVNERGDSWSRLCVLGGSAFLALAGLIALYTGEILAGPIYEATVHAFFVGFAASLVLAHFRLNSFLALGSLGVFYLSLALWIVGALAGWNTGKEISGLINILALLALAGIALRSKKSP
ncbi:MAG: hypothetical protein ACI906_003611 [Candidatus Latescibacterota bacterium]|jgi:hypothetical protein